MLREATMAEKIILDVDTGHDDMVALLMAAALREIEVLGVVAVAGNQVLERTLENTLNVCDCLGLTSPVYAGMDRPIIREQKTAAHIHGASGLDGPVFGKRSKEATPGHGVQFIIDTVLNNPHQVTLVPTGPLSDIAMAIRLESRLPRLVKQIVLMGGSLGAGNVTPHAEFNVFADGEAAHIVFSSGAKIVMMGLDVTMQVILNQRRSNTYLHYKSPQAQMFHASMANYADKCKVFGFDWPAMHDPCCIAYLADPSMFTLAPYHIEVVLGDKEHYGQTVGTAVQGKSNIEVALQVDTERFWALLERSLAHFD